MLSAPHLTGKQCRQEPVIAVHVLLYGFQQNDVHNIILVKKIKNS